MISHVWHICNVYSLYHITKINITYIYDICARNMSIHILQSSREQNKHVTCKIEEVKPKVQQYLVLRYSNLVQKVIIQGLP